MITYRGDTVPGSLNKFGVVSKMYLFIHSLGLLADLICQRIHLPKYYLVKLKLILVPKASHKSTDKEP